MGHGYSPRGTTEPPTTTMRTSYSGLHLAVERVAAKGELRQATGLDDFGLDHRIGELRLVVHVVVVPVRQRIASGEAGLTARAPACRAVVVLAAHVQDATNRPVAVAGELTLARRVGGAGLALPCRGGGGARQERKHSVQSPRARNLCPF